MDAQKASLVCAFHSICRIFFLSTGRWQRIVDTPPWRTTLQLLLLPPRRSKISFMELVVLRVLFMKVPSWIPLGILLATGGKKRKWVTESPMVRRSTDHEEHFHGT